LAVSRRIAKENKMKALAVGGTADHVHVLISLPGALSVAKAIQLLKGNSSKWIHETFPKLGALAWQEGCGACRSDGGVYSESNGAPPTTHVSRGIRGNAPQARFGL